MNPGLATALKAASKEGRKRGKGRDSKIETIGRSFGMEGHMGYMKYEAKLINAFIEAYKDATGEEMNMSN